MSEEPVVAPDATAPVAAEAKPAAETPKPAAETPAVVPEAVVETPTVAPAPSKPDIEAIREKRQLSQKQVSELVTQNRQNIARFKDLSSKIKLEKQRRDELNAKTKDLRAKRHEMIEKIKEARAKLATVLDEVQKIPAGPNAEQLKAEIDSLEWSLSTVARSAKAEKELSKKIRELEKQLPLAVKKVNASGAIRALRSEIRVLEEPLEALDKELHPALEEANGHHHKLISYYKEAEQLSKSISYAFSQLDMARLEAATDAKAYSEAVGVVREKEQGYQQELRELERAEREKERAEKDAAKNAVQQKISEAAKPIYEKFKAGKKISTDEFLILQGSGLL
ncbi:MAG: hypothetical protein WCX64_01210 [Candidatus Micrarchaeia archaeon]|jgi:uncharacterized coiled-coil DUF342 family protein